MTHTTEDAIEQTALSRKLLNFEFVYQIGLRRRTLWMPGTYTGASNRPDVRTQPIPASRPTRYLQNGRCPCKSFLGFFWSFSFRNMVTPA